MKNVLKNKLTVTIIVLSVTFLILIGYSVKRKNISFVENGVGASINSVQGVFYNFNSKVKDIIGFVYNYSDIRKEDEELRKKNNDLEGKLSNYKSLIEENERLRNMVNFKNQRSEYDYVGCDIKSKSGGSYLDQFVINKGTKDGIEKQMVVITAEGLVGMVTSVGTNWSTVQTLVNENFAVSAMVESTGENDGIVKGYKSGENKDLAKLYYLSIKSTIKEGDTISTSGIGRLYPKGIRIGKVIKVEEDKGKVMKNAVLEPYVNFNKLQEVFVVIPKNKSDNKEIRY